MLMEVFLIRHGECEANRDRMALGNTPLTPLGIEQAKNLQNIIPQSFDKIYTSNLIRAEMTARYAFGLNKTDSRVLIENDLREIDLGEQLEGLHADEIQLTKDEMRKWTYQLEDTMKGKYDTEPLDHFIKRTGDAFSKIVDKSLNDGDHCIFIFSHGGTMRSILSHRIGVIGNDGLKFWNTEIIRLKLNNGKWELLERRDDHIIGRDIKG